MRVGINPGYPPFASIVDDELVGIDVDLAKALADHLDVPIEFVPMGIDGLHDALIATQVDVVISSLQVEVWRLGEIVYTRPYFNMGLVLVTDMNSSVDVMEDVAGRSLALEFGSAADHEARLWSRRIPPFEVLPYELPDDALDAVRLGQADAALVDTVTAMTFQNAHPEWSSKLIEVTVTPLVIAVQRHRGTTFDTVDAALEDLLEEGTVDEIIERWL